MKFKAKAIMNVKQLSDNEIPHDNGFVTGSLLEDIIVGEYLEIEEGCIDFEWWARIDKETIEIVEDKNNDRK